MQRSVTIRLWNAYNIGPIVTNDPSVCVRAVLPDLVSSDAARERRPATLRDPIFLRSVNSPGYLASEGKFGRGGKAGGVTAGPTSTPRPQHPAPGPSAQPANDGRARSGFAPGPPVVSASGRGDARVSPSTAAAGGRSSSAGPGVLRATGRSSRADARSRRAR